MEDELEEFFDKVPETIRPQLDYSPVSLNVLESWLLELYGSPGSPDEFRADYKSIWDGAQQGLAKAGAVRCDDVLPQCCCRS